ncbi:MAG: hypothetical protein IIA14_06680 [SAR324 cluster bacterium]|nr:hypothetical protein [SAR324 cluster bacterium]
MISDYVSLSTRAGFNKSLGHFRLVSSLVDQMDRGKNLADVIDELEKNKAVEKQQIGPILNAVVIDRLAYRTLSVNLPMDTQDFDGFHNEVKNWNRFDIILAYHHPQLGISLINPKTKNQFEALQELNRDELMVAYLKAKREQDAELEPVALDALRELLLGRKAEETARFHDPVLDRPVPTATPQQPPAGVSVPSVQRPPPAGGTAARPPAPPQAAASAPEPAAKAPPAKPESAAGGKKKVTPKYSVQVTNELFHNGNVEAWKNIVESYKGKFPQLEVHVFHDGQKVNDLNALFKWGKVKHGDVILFSVAGEEIKGVAKLQRYLFEGASLRFTNFLKKDINKVLNLF